MNDFQLGMLCGCLFSIAGVFIWVWICNIFTPNNNPPKERDPADWWKDT